MAIKGCASDTGPAECNESGVAGFLPLQLAIRHDPGVAIRTDFTPVRGARQRFELLAWPVVLTVITELEGIGIRHCITERSVAETRACWALNNTLVSTSYVLNTDFRGVESGST